ncbi:MAG: tetratricopeptide repeat protein, partial [Planctomycetota bacterium]
MTPTLVALVLAFPLFTTGPEAPPPQAPWQRCFDAIDWAYAAEVPNSETQLIELVSKGAMVAYSQQWIRAAIAAGPSIDECLARAKEEKKLLLWYIPALEGQQMILPHFIDRYMTIGPLSDPDVTTMINRRFVALKMPAGGILAKTYQITAPDFLEPGFLVFLPSGEVIHRMNRINTFGSDYFEFVLSTLLAEHATAIAPSPACSLAKKAWERGGDVESTLRYATESIADGDYETAQRVLEKLTDHNEPRVHYVLATIQRHLRNGKRAIAELQRASALQPPPSLAAEIEAERGLIELRQGDFSAATVHLQKAIATPTSKRMLEARYYLGAVQYLTQRDDDAIATWKKAGAASTTSIWSAKAHAYAITGSDGARGEGPLTRSMEDVRWADPEAYALRTDTQWRRSTRDATKIARRAVEFLLQEQRADGSWVGPRWGGRKDRTQRPCNIEKAISALVCAALQEWRKVNPSTIDRALRHGDRYLLDEDCVDRDGVIWVYADCYRLLYFSQRIKKLKGKARREVRAAMQQWVEHLVAQQRRNKGPFQHYTYTSTFVTATVTYCLHRARGAGITVPDEVFTTSARVLEATRGPNGRFGYLVEHPQVGRTDDGAAGRQPLCDWVLFLCGRNDEQGLNRALQVFFANYDTSIEPARKSNFHIPSLDNTAGYYFFHNFYPACEAAAASGKHARKNKRKLLQLLCELPEIDGTPGATVNRLLSTMAWDA